MSIEPPGGLATALVIIVLLTPGQALTFLQVGQGAAYALSLGTGRASYTGPQFVSISGAISPAPSSPAVVAISVLAPDGNQVESLSATASVSGRFDVSFVGGGDQDWTSGKYVVTASYSGATATATFQWDQPPASTFSLFWITDTQFLSETNEGLFLNTTGWIADHWSQYNGKMVFLTGDIAQYADVRGEYANASEAMSVLLDDGIPYTWDAGNHDDLSSQPPSWLGSSEPAFNATNVAQTVDRTGYAHWVGSFDGGMDTAVNFTADSLGFLVIDLEFNADAQALSWASGLLANSTYTRDYVIVATHAYINATGSLDDPKWGPILHDFTTTLTSLMDNYSSRVVLTMNGHFGTPSGYHTPSPVDGRYELMFNRQDCTDVSPCNSPGASTPDYKRVGASTVTILTFDTLSNQLSVRSFDVFEGRYLNDSGDQYTLPGVLPGIQTTTATLPTTTSAVTPVRSVPGSSLGAWALAAVLAVGVLTVYVVKTSKRRAGPSATS